MNMFFTTSRSLKFLLALFSFSLLVACIGVPRQSAVPQSLTARAQIEGMPGIRYFVDSAEGIQNFTIDAQKLESVHVGSALADASYLSLSGGGDNGAFGAGLLVGWTQRGDRPSFKLVTGVSTGALMAPFAYLGSEYDSVLTKLYTTTNTADIYVTRNIFSGVMDDSLVSDHPLKVLLDQYIDSSLLEKIAHEYVVNRRALLIGTTDIDAGQPVVWNMGQIASIGGPQALSLFKQVMLASASVPVLFPPVMFDVMVNNLAYQEMHVDGGASTQVFLYPYAVSVDSVKMGIPFEKKRRAFIIRNDKLSSSWEDTERWSVAIALRSVEQIIEKQGNGDLLKIYDITKKDGVEFNLAYIDQDFEMKSQSMFDTQYMQALFNYGQAKARAGYPWAHSLPTLNARNHSLR